MSRLSRQNRPNWLPMLPICYQKFNRAAWAEPVGGAAQNTSNTSSAIVPQAVALLSGISRESPTPDARLMMRWGMTWFL